MIDLKSTIEKAKSGDKEAYGQLYTELYTPIFKYVLSRTRNKELAEDITSDVFLRFLKSIGDYTSQTDTPLPYLYTIAKNLIINNGLKKKTDQLPEEAAEYIGDGKATQLETSIQKEEVARVLETLSLLPEDQAEVVRLRYLGQLETKEIAAALGKTEVNIRKIESRALSKLRELLK